MNVFLIARCIVIQVPTNKAFLQINFLLRYICIMYMYVLFMRVELKKSI